MVFRNAASAATAALCLSSAAAWGQTVPLEPAGSTTPAAAAGYTADGLTDIIVTAQRRDERLQSVPVAVSVITGDYLRENQVRTLQDLGASVPSLVVAADVNYGSAPLSIRGIGGANGGGNIFADEPVAVYVDDAFVSRLRLSTADLIDVGAIEVLRGPQGTLYGRNSTAGAVLIRSAEPTVDLTARATGSIATLGEYRAQAAVSGPLSTDGTLTARLAGGYSSRDGWGHNDFGGPNLNRGRDWQARAFLRYKPSSALTIDLIGDVSYQKNFPGTLAIYSPSNLRDQATNPTGTNVVVPYVVRPDLQSLLDGNRFQLNQTTFTRINGQNLTGRINWGLGPVTLTSVTNYRRWQMQGAQDSDGTLIDPPTPAFVTGDTPNIGDNNGHFRDDQVSQEIRLASNGSARLSWIVGGFYFHEHNITDPIVINNRLAGPGGAGTSATFNAGQLTDAFALFANASYEIVDGLKLSVGGRYSNELKNVTDTMVVTTINQFDPPGPLFFTAGQALVPANTLVGRRRFTNFSPRVVLDYKATESVLLYASYSQGFKSGGFNAFRGNNFGFEPEDITAYEIGAKTDIGRMFRLNASAYHYDYRNLQVRTPVPSGGVGIESAAKARVQGIEFEATALPMRGLRFDGNVSILDAKFVAGTLSAITQPSFVFGTNPAVVAQTIAGNQLTRAPKLQAALTGRYEFDVGWGKVSLQTSARHQSSVFFLETQQNTPTYRGAAWTEIDARLALAGQADRWEVAVFGRNLNDNRHLSQVTSFFGLPNASVNEPRKIGVQFGIKY